MLFSRLHNKHVLTDSSLFGLTDSKLDRVWSFTHAEHTSKESPQRRVSEPGRSRDEGTERVVRPRTRRRSSAPAKNERWRTNESSGGSGSRSGSREVAHQEGVSSTRIPSTSGSVDSMEAILYEIAAISAPDNTYRGDDAHGYRGE
jgi:hypothetical protein